MKLRALRLYNVRRFEGRGVAVEGLGDGVNVLAAPNEAGKSTCFDALRALFLESHGGVGKPVKSLQPWSGGGVVVEADVETGAGLFRLRKQFLAGRRAQVHDLRADRLVAQGGDAEAWITRALGGPGAPAGLLWVQQGAAELSTGRDREATLSHEARRDALAAVAGEVEALTGGKRMDHARQRCREALSALLTDTGRPRKGGPLSDALAEVARHSEAETALSAQVETLRADLARRREARRRLASLSDAAAAEERAAALRQSRDALRAAEQHAAAVETAGQAARLAELTAAQAARALSDWRGAVAEAARRAEARAETAGALDGAGAEAADAARAEAEAAAALAAAETRAAAASRALAAARAEAAARAAASALESRAGTLASAETAHAEVVAARAEAAALAPPDGAAARIAALDDTARTLRAAAEAAAARVLVAPLPGAETAFTLDGAPIAPNVSLSAAAPLRIEIDGRGAVLVSPGAAGREGRARLAEAEAALARALAEAGAPSRAALDARMGAAKARAAEADIAVATLAALAPQGLDALRAEVAALRRATQPRTPQERPSAEPEAAEPELAEPEFADPETAEAAAEAAARAVEAARRHHAVAQKRLSGAESAQAVAAARHEEADRLARAAEERLGPPDARPAREAALLTEDARAADAARAAVAARERLRGEAPDLAGARAAEQRAATAHRNAETDIARLGVDIAHLDGAIESRAGDAPEEALTEARGRRAAAESRAAALQAEADGLTRLARALDEARAGASAHYFQPVLAELRPLLAMLMDSADIAFDEAALLPAEMTRAGRAEPVESLSGGTREQLAVLTRLAFARLIARGGGSAPVILDDALAFSDDDRIERMFDALHRQASDLQILVLTCRQRAFERLGGTVLRMEDWAG